MLDFPRWRKCLILAPLIIGILFALPTFLPGYVYNQLPSALQHKVNLGLDLSGGSHILEEAAPEEVVKQRLTVMEDQVRAALRPDDGKPRIDIGDISSNGGKLRFMVRDSRQVDAAVERIRPLTQGAGLTGQRDFDVTVVDGQTVTVTPTQAGLDAALDRAMETAVKVIETRINALGTREPTIVRQGSNRILVQVPGLQDPQQLKDLIGQTAKLEFKLVDVTANPAEVQQGRAPIGSQVLELADQPGQKIAVKRAIMVSGEELIDANQEFDENNKPSVAIQFNGSGGRKFGRVTSENVNRPFAMILDDKVLSAPNILGPILGGRASITGNFTVNEANQLAIALRSGQLPVKLTVVEERTVGPQLGADSIRAGIIASTLAIFLVVVFMLVTYGRFGVYANIAVIINVLVILGAMAILNATLTLPGIAGFVLTIGTAVDANVLIYERIREERRRGRTVIQSVEFGYKEASRTIFEANVTHAIAGLIMLILGSGPVKGFAVVLLIGIATSVFTAVTFTRMLAAGWLRRRRPAEIVMGFLRIVPDNTNIGFVAMRKWAFALTAFLTVLAVGATAYHRLNLGVDFVGGLMIEAKFKTEPALDKVRSSVDRLNVGEGSLQPFGDPKVIAIRLPLPASKAEGANNAVVAKVRTELQKEYPGVTFSRVETVSGKVSGELIQKGILAVMLAVIGIAIFSWFRYEWQFGVSTFVAIMHDVLMTLGFFALTQLEFDLNIVAAVLTIIGYSINDKMVIDDRIRENMRKYRKMDMKALIDLSVNETLPRTVMTSFTIMLALAALLLFGGHVLRGFTAAMMLGIVVGTYSSIYVSSSLLISLGLSPQVGDKKKRVGPPEALGRGERIS